MDNTMTCEHSHLKTAEITVRVSEIIVIRMHLVQLIAADKVVVTPSRVPVPT